MAEQINLQPGSSSAQYPALKAMLEYDAQPSGDGQQEQRQESYDAFLRNVEQSSHDIDDVAANREDIEKAGKALVDKYEIDAGFFEDPRRSLLFTAMADRWSRKGSNRSEEIFLEDALTLLAHEYSPRLTEVYEYAKQDQIESDDEHELKVYDKYTDQRLSSELKQAIDGGLLDDIKEKLGITPENEDPYEVRVLSTGDNHSISGLHGPSIPEWDSVPGTREEKEQFFDEIKQVHNDIDHWKEGLTTRMEEFQKERGHEGEEISPAWVTRVAGRTLLCLPMPYAEKILHPEITANARYYDAKNAERDLAFLQHEYTHTQGGLNIDGIDFGISLEELRAEEFSDNHHGYDDIKFFARDFGVITGKDLTDFFVDKPKGGDAYSVFSEIANTVGLDRMLEVAMVRPAAYDRLQHNLLNSMVAEHLKGFDGVISRLVEDKVAQGKEGEIDGRITHHAHKILDKAAKDPGFIDVYFHARTRYYAAGIITSKIAQTLDRLKADPSVN